MTPAPSTSTLTVIAKRQPAQGLKIVDLDLGAELISTKTVALVTVKEETSAQAQRQLAGSLARLQVEAVMMTLLEADRLPPDLRDPTEPAPLLIGTALPRHTTATE